MIQIITTNYNTSEFIYYQYSLLKKYFKNEFTYTVFDNAEKVEEKEYAKNICNKLKLQVIDIPPQIHDSVSGGDSFRAGRACTFAIQYMLENTKPTDKIFLMDTDMFLVKEFNINSFEADIYGIWQARSGKDGKEVNYFTNQLFLLNPACVSDKNQINFEPATINGANCDCGGNLYYFINNNNLKLGKFDNVIDTVPNYKKLLTEELKQYMKKDEEFGKELGMNKIADFFDFTFLHFRISTNWIHNNKHADRIENLYKFLNTHIEPINFLK